MLRTLALALAAALGPALAHAQQFPSRPAGGADPQSPPQGAQGSLGDLLRQRIQQSGMTAEQIRARLGAMGYSENVIDQYLSPASRGQPAPAPTLEVLSAAAALGFGDFAPAPEGAAGQVRDLVALTRSDSILLDTLGFVFGRDSIPTRADTGGVLRLDRAAVSRLSDWIRRPRLFGLDIFRRATSQFSTLTSGPVDPDYRLGPGDELVLILTGDVELAHSLPVTREGFIVIPQVGQIFVANLTLDQLRSLLYTRLSRVYSGVQRGAGGTTRFEITVARLRVSQIFVNGDVLRPGAYPVSGMSTAMNALYLAGGPTEQGNFRQVQVLRRGQTIRTVDLYDYLLHGNTRDDIRLEQGDVVFVPPRARRVQIAGSVLRPGIYDLAESEGLRELIQIAGGLLPEASTGRAHVERILPPEQREPGGRERTVVDADLVAVMAASPTEGFRLLPDDRVTIFPVTREVRNRVLISGNVWRPGPYSVGATTTLFGLIREAGGVRPDTYLERAHVVRLMPDSTRRLIPVNLSGVVQRDVSSSAPGVGAGAESDLELQEADEITIFSRSGFRGAREIAVFGNVNRAGTFLFRDSMTLRDAVMLAGGLRDEAYLLEAEIARIPARRRDPGDLAQIIHVPLDSSYVLDATGYLERETTPRGENPLLQPYDNIFIRRVPGWELQRYVTVTGEVRFPGRYALTRRDERLSDVITRAGGATADAYVRGGQVYRAEGRVGRIGIDFERILRSPNSRDDLVLMAGDSIHLPPFQAVVIVEGAVNNPVAVAYERGRSTSYYVDRAGGFTPQADRRRTYVIQINGMVFRRGTDPEPGARVVVPEKIQGEPIISTAIQGFTAVASLLTTALSMVILSRQF